MRQKLVRVLWLLLACDVSLGRHFTIIGPETATLGSQYKAFLTSSEYEVPTQLQVKVFSGEKQIFSETFNMEKSMSQEIILNIPSTEESEEYILQAKYDENGKVFEKNIKILRKKFSVFTQTDKAIYKPGDNVHFRVLVLNTEMKPYQFNELKVAFTDGDKKKAGMMDIPIDPKKIIYGGSFQLPSQLVVGKWGVHVLVDGSKTLQNFQVVDYDLPEFEANIEPNSTHVLLTAQVIMLKISAKHLYGRGQKYVSGSAVINATVYASGEKVFTTSKDVNNIVTTTDVFFRLNELKIDDRFNQTVVKFEVVFKEDSTKRQTSAETFVIVHRKEYFDSEIVGEKPFLTPGQPYRMKVFIRNFDKSLVKEDDVVNVKVIRYSYSSCEKKAKLKKSVLRNQEKKKNLNNGSVDIEVDVPLGTHGMIFGVYYKGSWNKDHKIWRIPTKTRENLDLQLQMINRNEVSAKVVATHDMNKIFSLIIGRKGIVHHKQHDFALKSEFDFKIPITPEMRPSLLPLSNLIVYYIQPRGEIIFNQIKLQFDDLLANFLDVELESSDVVPGGDARITVKTASYSLVGLMSEDERVSIFKSPNEISEDKVKKELNALFHKDVFNISNREDANSLLAESNAFVLTDAVDLEPSCGNVRFLNLGDDEKDYDEVDSSENGAYKGPSIHFTSDQIPETWLFTEFQVDRSGQHVLSKKVPFASTSYLISGFTIHPVHGLGLSKPQKLNAFKDFLPEINAPLYVKVGEIIQVKVFLHNFLQSSSREKVTMTLYNDASSFELLDRKPDRTCSYESHKSQIEAAELLSMSGNSDNYVTFYLKPIKAGTFNLKAKAVFETNSAETFKTIHSELSGLKKSQNKVKFFDLRARKFDSFYFDMSLDDNVHKNSVQMKASVTGDLLGPALDNIEGLLDSPSGTTIQELTDFIPTAFLLNYLNSMNRLTQNRRVFGISCLERGYEFVLTQKLKSPHYGAYKEWDSDLPDIATTAFVMKFLSVAKHWIEIQDSNIVDALSYLKSKQQRSGSFLDEEQNESVELTAFVAIAYLENPPYIERFKQSINKALSYISSNFESFQDNNYVLALSAYALSLGKNSAAKSFIEKLDNNAVINKDLKFWNSDIPSKNVATAAYAILALVNSAQHLKSREILNWLLTQRNENGGFHTSMDTVIGIQAVSALAEYFHSDRNEMDLRFLYGDDRSKTVKIFDSYDRKETEAIDIPLIDGVSVQANGTGIAYVQVWQTYLMRLPESSEKFNLDIKPVQHHSRDGSLSVKFCIKYKLQQKSKLSVAEIALPSGYMFDDKNFSNSAVKSFKTRRGKSIVSLFLLSIGTQPICIEISALKQFFVSSSTPYAVKVYEADDPATFTVNYYLPFPSAVCDKRN